MAFRLFLGFVLCSVGAFSCAELCPLEGEDSGSRHEYSDGHTRRHGFGSSVCQQVLFSFLRDVPSRYFSFLSVGPDCYGPIQHLDFSHLDFLHHIETFCNTSPKAIEAKM